MAQASWPASLPATLLLEGLSFQPKSAVVRTQMDAGPGKARRRYTARSVVFSGRQVFDAADFGAFDAFYHTVLAGGVLRFNFTDPVTLETAEFRFAGDYAAKAVDGLFEVSMSLERL